MNLFALSGLLVGVTCIAMAGWVFLANRNNPVNKLWSFFCIFVSIWGFGVLAIGLAKTPDKALIFWRLAYTSVILIPALFYNFVLIFLGLRRRSSLLIVYVITLLFEIANFTPLFMPSVKWMFDQLYYVAPPGFLYPFFVFFFIAIVTVSHIYLWQFMHAAGSESKKTQVRWFFMASFIGFLGAATCFLPVFGIKIYPYGNFTVPLYPVIMAYAIVRHQLMDIEVIIKRAAVFACLFAFVYGTFTIFTLIGQEFFRNVLGWSQWTATIPTIVVIVLALKPLENFLIERTDKFLFQKKYDYKQILTAFLDEIVTVLNLEEIFEKTIKLLEETLHPEAIAIFLFDKAGDRFNLYQGIGYGDIDLKLEKGSKMFNFIKSQKGILSTEGQKLSDEIKREMNHSRVRLVIPLAFQSELIGAIVLGAKKSGDNYSQEELDSLSGLLKTEAIAIKNARYIDELNAANTEVQHAKTMKQIADMADGMSHQFNNRFQAISVPLGFVKLLMDKTIATSGGLSAEEQLKKLKEAFLKTSETVSKAAANAVRGGDIAKGLLKYARPEKAGFEMQDISKIINLSIEMLGYKHDDWADIEIARNFSKDPPLTWANISYLQDIYFIVLDNAYDAIKQKKEMQPEVKGMISLNVSHDKIRNSIRIAIKDNGIGMKPEILEKVRAAVPYVTTKASSSQKSGYGSGVQVLTRLVKLHDGRIDYESVYGEGTATVIDIPVRGKPEDQSSDKNGRN